MERTLRLPSNEPKLFRGLHKAAPCQHRYRPVDHERSPLATASALCIRRWSAPSPVQPERHDSDWPVHLVGVSSAYAPVVPPSAAAEAEGAVPRTAAVVEGLLAPSSCTTAARPPASVCPPAQTRARSASFRRTGAG